jgi:hypothetical protein
MAPIASIPGLSPHTSTTQSRRGVLLLVVLSMLTLFLMLGASYLVVAIRARKVSKAFADKIVAPATVGPNAARVVDAAFMTVARGSTSPGINTAFTQDSLLADKYGGSALTGQITAASAWNGSEAFIQIQASRLSPAPSSISLLPGRVLTFTMPGVSISTRILRAFGNSPTSPTLIVPAGTTANGLALSVGMVQAALARGTQGTTPHFLINGREFDDSSNNEPHDGFDSDNPLLTRMIPDAAGGSPTVSAANMYGASPTLTVDNDGDGTEDSNFLPVGLPQFTMSSGAVIQPRAAVLVVELDGRLNVNVHDSTIDADTSDPTNMQSLYPRYYSVNEIPGNGVDDDSNGGTDDQYTWTSPGGSPPPLEFSSFPRGAGAATSDTSLRKSNVLPTLSGRAQSATSRSSTLLATARVMGGVSNNDNLAQKPSNSDTQRPIPKIGGAEGRYGGSPSATNQPWDGTTLTPAALPRPGLAGFNDTITLERERWTVALTPDVNRPGNQIAANFFTDPGRYGSPPDVKGRMRIWADPSTGRPVFYKPYWDENGRSGGSTTISDNEVVDDPFETNLSRNGPRINAVTNPGTGGIKVDNLFTAADLEGLLRSHDPDSPRLSRRLVAINDRSAEMNRLRVTTESWDTPAIVGVRWEQSIRSAFSQLLERNDAHLFFAPETIAGHRLDINRPFHDFTRPPTEFLFDEPYFYDANANWTRDNSENTNTGELRRQQFAKHLYCLLVAIARGDNATMTAQTAERIAQYAVNVVDFRDADSIMTRFSYDPAFAPGSTTWSPGATNYVWGCERPEILLTETYAWHDRRTDDENIGGSVQDGSDASFDQIRRPRGAFFVELTCPWGSEVREYGSGTVRPLTDPTNSPLPSNRLRADLLPMELVQTEDANANGVLDSGEDVIPNNKIDANPPRNRLTTAVNLEKTVPNATAANRSPVWRLVSTRKFTPNPSNRAFGADPLLPATDHPNESILDPSRPGGPGIDRIFYFTQPPSALANEIPGAVFWQQAPPANPLTPGNYRVYGTDAPLDPAGGGGGPAHVAVFAGDGGKPATLTEPTVAAATDPYDSLMQAVTGPPNTPSPATGMVNTWGTAIDDPLDAYGPSTKPIPPGANLTSDPLLAADGTALLLQNGTHENFAVIHLQRLADPTRPFNNTPSSPQFNPYLTVDCLPVDLAVVNSVRVKNPNQPASGLPGIVAGNYDEPGDPCKEYGHGTNTLASTERGGDPDPAVDDPTRSPDIWSRRLRYVIRTLQDSHAFITDAVTALGIAPAANLPGSPLGTRAAGVPRHTLDGQITSIQVTDNGSGYVSTATVNISGGGGNGATAVVSVSRGVVTEIRVTNPGSGYTNAPSITVSGGGGSGATATAFIGGPPSRLTNAGSPAFLHWANRPFTSGQELALVPIASPFHLLQLHGIDTPSLIADQQFAHLAGFWENSIPPAPWNAIAGRSPANSLSFLDCVHVPSRFAGLYSTVPNAAANTAALAALGLDNYPTDHISTFREPGRINVNTITDQSAWRAIFGSRDAIGAVTPGGPVDPDVDQTSSGADRLPRWAPNIFGPALPVAQPARGSAGTATPTIAAFFLAMPGPLADSDADTVAPDRATRNGGYRDAFTGDSNRHRSTDRNALFRYQTMMQLSDRVTTRSNVFAVWVTIGYFDTSTGNEVQPVTRHRGFYLFDRSIPVAYEQGQNHNIRDAILLRRIIQ